MRTLETVTLTVLLSFAAGVIVMDMAHDYRARQAEALIVHPAKPDLRQYVCTHLMMTRKTCGAV